MDKEDLKYLKALTKDLKGAEVIGGNPIEEGSTGVIQMTDILRDEIVGELTEICKRNSK